MEDRTRGRSLLSYLLVTIQFGALGVIALTGAWFAHQPPLLALQVAAMALGLWAIASFRVQLLRILPDVPEGGYFVGRGPYRFIRHPMYAALLLATLPAVIADPSVLRVATWGVLLIDIIFKLHHEEELLSAAFAEYGAYQATTKRLVPFLY